MADATAFLLSSDSPYLTGHDLVVDGATTGNHWKASRPVEHYIRLTVVGLSFRFSALQALRLITRL